VSSAARWPNRLFFLHSSSAGGSNRAEREIFWRALYFLSGMSATAFAPGVPARGADYGPCASPTSSGLGLLTFWGDGAGVYTIQNQHRSLPAWLDSWDVNVLLWPVQTNLPLALPHMFFTAREKVSP